MQILSEIYMYVESEPGIHKMFAEQDHGPFEEYCVGEFRKDGDFYVFYPSAGVAMTCKTLREASKKTSNLNGEA